MRSWCFTRQLCPRQHTLAASYTSNYAAALLAGVMFDKRSSDIARRTTPGEMGVSRNSYMLKHNHQAPGLRNCGFDA